MPGAKTDYKASLLNSNLECMTELKLIENQAEPIQGLHDYMVVSGRILPAENQLAPWVTSL